MNEIVIIFYALSISGLAFFLFVRKIFDFVSVGFIGQLIYFSPGFYGYVGSPAYPGVLPSVPISLDVYAIWAACLVGTLAAGVIYRPDSSQLPPFRTSVELDVSFIGLILLSAAVTIYLQGDGLFSADKQEVLDSVDRTFLLFASTCQLAAISFAIQRKWYFLAVPGMGLLFLLYVGFRGEFAVSVIAIFAYIARSRGIFIFLKPRFLFPSLTAAALLLGYKPFLTAYRVGNWRSLEMLQMSQTLGDTLILQFEPFLTQAVLNQVVIRNFQAPGSSLLDALVAFVPFLAPALGLAPEDVAFNFQEILFPGVPYGLTGSPQSQFYAALGVLGLVIFIAALNLGLVLASHMLRSRRPTLTLVALGVGAFLAFYIQRNDLANSLTLINRIVIAVFLAWLGAFVLSAGIPRGRKASAQKIAPTHEAGLK